MYWIRGEHYSGEVVREYPDPATGEMIRISKYLHRYVIYNGYTRLKGFPDKLTAERFIATYLDASQ